MKGVRYHVWMDEEDDSDSFTILLDELLAPLIAMKYFLLIPSHDSRSANETWHCYLQFVTLSSI